MIFLIRLVNLGEIKINIIMRRTDITLTLIKITLKLSLRIFMIEIILILYPQ